jgi:hypothetical protein
MIRSRSWVQFDPCHITKARTGQVWPVRSGSLAPGYSYMSVLGCTNHLSVSARLIVRFITLAMVGHFVSCMDAKTCSRNSGRNSNRNGWVLSTCADFRRDVLR